MGRKVLAGPGDAHRIKKAAWTLAKMATLRILHFWPIVRMVLNLSSRHGYQGCGFWALAGKVRGTSLVLTFRKAFLGNQSKGKCLQASDTMLLLYIAKLCSHLRTRFHKVAPNSHNPTLSSLFDFRSVRYSYEHYAESCDKNQKDHSPRLLAHVKLLSKVITNSMWHSGDLRDKWALTLRQKKKLHRELPEISFASWFWGYIMAPGLPLIMNWRNALTM